MARVMKCFNTEEEFQEWVNSPQMRTPYTCAIKENGNVHYFDGDDKDYSVTAVIKKTCWVKLGTPGLMTVISAVCLNGVEVDLNECPDGKKSSFYYRKETTKNNTDGQFIWHEMDDFEYSPTMVGDDEIETRGGIHWTKNHTVMNYYPRRFARGYPGSNADKFLYVKKGDVLKFIFRNRFISLTDGMLFDLFGILGNDTDTHPKLFSLNGIAKEIVIGDGFRNISGRLLKTKKCKKVFFGKNVRKIDNSFGYCLGNYEGKKVFMRKKAEILNDTNTNTKIIRI